MLRQLHKKDDKNLLVGYSGADDAAVYRIAPDRALVVTVDFFPPMVNDPYQFGQVAAANALSDVWAMGGKPIIALNLVGFPTKKLPLSLLTDILNGGADKVHEAGAVIGGGHSVEDAEIKYGLSVTGEVHPDRIWKNGTVRIGDALILTKPLGTGLLSSAAKSENDNGPVVREGIRWMTTLNGTGISYLHAARVSSATDITGFGFLGHARELVEGSHASLEILARQVPVIPGIENYFKEKYKTRGARQTREFLGNVVAFPKALGEWQNELLFDPQTSGGLLIAVHEDDAETLCHQLRHSGLEFAAIVGRVIPARDEIRIYVLDA